VLVVAGFSLRDEQEKSATAQTSSARAQANLKLYGLCLDNDSRRFPLKSAFAREGLTGWRREFFEEREKPGVPPEHLYARRSNGCKDGINGQVS